MREVEKFFFFLIYRMCGKFFSSFSIFKAREFLYLTECTMNSMMCAQSQHGFVGWTKNMLMLCCWNFHAFPASFLCYFSEEKSW
jgi:hypothetical protein